MPRSSRSDNTSRQMTAALLSVDSPTMPSASITSSALTPAVLAQSSTTPGLRITSIASCIGSRLRTPILPSISVACRSTAIRSAVILIRPMPSSLPLRTKLACVRPPRSVKPSKSSDMPRRHRLTVCNCSGTGSERIAWATSSAHLATNPVAPRPKRPE